MVKWEETRGATEPEGLRGERNDWVSRIRPSLSRSRFHWMCQIRDALQILNQGYLAPVFFKKQLQPPGVKYFYFARMIIC